jgi:hypothetical protein
LVQLTARRAAQKRLGQAVLRTDAFFELTKTNSNRYKSDMPSKLNPKCAAIDKEIKDLQKDLQTAAPGQKAGIVKEIKKLQIELAACKKKYPK